MPLWFYLLLEKLARDIFRCDSNKMQLVEKNEEHRKKSFPIGGVHF